MDDAQTTPQLAVLTSALRVDVSLITSTKQGAVCAKVRRI